MSDGGSFLRRLAAAGLAAAGVISGLSAASSAQ
jgi:hypothetical protein